MLDCMIQAQWLEKTFVFAKLTIDSHAILYQTVDCTHCLLCLIKNDLLIVFLLMALWLYARVTNLMQSNESHVRDFLQHSAALMKNQRNNENTKKKQKPTIKTCRCMLECLSCLRSTNRKMPVNSRVFTTIQCCNFILYSSFVVD